MFYFLFSVEFLLAMHYLAPSWLFFSHESFAKVEKEKDGATIKSKKNAEGRKVRQAVFAFFRFGMDNIKYET